MSEATFLSGQPLSEHVKLICGGKDVCCAVAFLGRGMKDALFSEGVENVKLLCDISMGCTSKRALNEFGAPRQPRAALNDRLRVRDGLHGKVYLSSKGAVVGSPNMSTRGLGRTLLGDWNLETGVFLLPASDGWKQIKSWFNEEFEAAQPVSWKDVERASDMDHDAGRPPTAVELSGSLLERVHSHPERFSDVLFVLTSELLEKTEERKILKSEGYGKSDKVQVIIHDANLPRSDHSGLVISFHADQESKRLYTQGFVNSHPSARDDELTIIGKESWDTLRRRLAQSDLSRKASKADRAVLKQLMARDQATYTAAQFYAAIEDLRKPDEGE